MYDDNFIKNDIIPSAPRETEIEDPQRIMEFSMDIKDEYIEDSGNQVEIGGNDRYVSVCRKHYKEALNLGR